MSIAVLRAQAMRLNQRLAAANKPGALFCLIKYDGSNLAECKEKYSTYLEFEGDKHCFIVNMSENGDFSLDAD